VASLWNGQQKEGVKTAEKSEGAMQITGAIRVAVVVQKESPTAFAAGLNTLSRER